MTKTILVVGDWVVDEHWVVGPERSTTASRRGESHYHVLHEPGSSVEALCGAGLVASVLGSASQGDGPLFDVHGVGAWHTEDQAALESMMCPGGLKGHNRFQVVRSELRHKEPAGFGVALHNLHLQEDSQAGTTTRVVRIYLEDAGKVRLLHRIDWSRPPNQLSGNHGAAWITEPGAAEAWFADSTLGVGKIVPDVIVIKDLVKGVVSKELIQGLVANFRGSPKRPRWYISSKKWHHVRSDKEPDTWELAPDSWIRELMGEVDLRLLFVPQVAADAAMSDRHHCINSWVSGAGNAKGKRSEPTWHALMLMQELARTTAGTAGSPDVAVQPDGERVFARVEQGTKSSLLVRSLDAGAAGSQGLVPLASVLFAAVVGLMESPNSKDPPRLHAVLDPAISFAKEWVAHEAERFKPKLWLPEHAKTRLKALDLVKPGTEATRDSKSEADGDNVHMPWEETLLEWEASRKSGIVGGEGNHPRIELWRAMTDVEGYICLVASKRRTVRAIKRVLREFRAQSRPEKHVSMLIEADPGSGKTFLLDKLAAQFDFELTPYNITRMVSLSEIVDCFDDIVSRQSASSTPKPLLVFFDEINALLDQNQVYSMFLDPIDRGVYTRAGRPFSIRPCVWVFAGTGMGEGRPETKGSDFKSRLTLHPQPFGADLLKSSSDTEDDHRNLSDAELERVYVGAQLLRKAFPEVESTTNLVLDAFRLLCPTVSLRDQARFVDKFTDVHPPTVWASSVPEELIIQTWNDERDLADARAGPYRVDEKDVHRAPARCAKRLATLRTEFDTQLDAWRTRRSSAKEGKVEIHEKRQSGS
ncbi:hypothetical protein PHYC_03256 [Phycisphaerales bacterium]|nr:hypothetical protein PHYC_03256 [Phycisphaerales bacterium]